AELDRRGMAPSLLVGHSLGGAAVLAAARRIDSTRAVATIGAPYDPGHVTHNFGDALDKIAADGSAEVPLGGRKIRIG
ncbi:MAG TPA: osmotically inducible protein C, partial [Roseovarius nubinhibens]|nr:osmotically inducible protein C [Roseovarius nubinhibens]